MSSSHSTFWDDLLEYIDDRRVIPIVGPELLRVQQEGREVLLHDFLAGRLAERLGLAPPATVGGDALHQVICRHIERGGRREDVYPRIRSIMKDTAFPTPGPLRKLARIEHFNLYVATTFDSLMEQALAEERGGPGKVQSIAYTPNSVQDLPAEMHKLEQPTVYHLLGKVSAAPEYVITEEDTLEFLYAMQGEKRRPELLFDELKSRHLLLIGNQFPDWLARFFIRLAKGGRLSGPRDSLEIVADGMAGQDRNLVLFLQNFSYHTRVFAEGGAVEFVAELARRYEERHKPALPAAPAAPVTAAGAGDGDDAAEMPPGAVFLSYASEDLEVVQKMRDALDEGGVEVWFDKRKLQPGDAYDAKIRRNIKNCSLFLPVISARTEKRREGYFRLEWRLAAERAMQIDDTVPFIIPVGIDDTPEGKALVPDSFRSVHWARLPEGRLTPEFANKLVKLVRDFHRRERGQT